MQGGLTTRTKPDRRRGAMTWWALGSVAAILFAGCSNASVAGQPSSSPAASASSAPGVTAHQISVGSVATLSGDLAADFAPIVPGVRAYFDMVDAHGGVDGRKIVLTKALDDDTVDNEQVTRTLIQQDHVFALVGEATAFFTGAQFLVQTGTPTFGYALSNDWTPAKNMFAAYGSVIDYTTTESFFPYIAHQLHSRVAALVAYGVPQSADECTDAALALRKYGVDVGYSDLAVPIGSSLSSDVVHMKQAGVDLVISCMDVPGNLDLSRAIQQNGMTGVKQLWLDGYDLPTLRQYTSLMQNTFFLVQHVPFQANSQFPNEFPGLQQYIATMNRYEPAYTYNEVAMEGWLNAALFVQGLRDVKGSLTQKKLIDAINHITRFTADGLTTPTNWEIAHVRDTSPSCETFVAAKGTTFKVVFNRGKDIWVCFPTKGRVNPDDPVAPPLGAPGT
jgi:ABC-type branched-subunit amino acid transport system substrate-binding protein